MQLKGFKVTDSKRKTKFGIAAKSLQDFKHKIKSKFPNSNYLEKKIKENNFKLYLCDGTLVADDEYFDTIPEQTVFIWTNEKNFKSESEVLYEIVTNSNSQLLNCGRKSSDFLSDRLKEKLANLAEVLKQTSDRSRLSTKFEDREWFEGIMTKHKTKEQFLFSKSQDRIRTYFYKTREELNKLSKSKFTKSRQFEQLENFLADLQTKLKEYNYFGCFFDRRCATENVTNSAKRKKDNRLQSLCDANGVFACQGLWNKEKCLYSPIHMINPYMNREQRLMFQMWNLDHQIERSRTIIPAVLNIFVERWSDSEINTELVFDDLFTLNNLKLVHIICHDKGCHSIPSQDDENRYCL